ncbi:MAG: hypothetical protein Q8J71_08405 [Brevundimonas sp.]|nr:hypothetical protein [Brevundimonas sp.]
MNQTTLKWLRLFTPAALAWLLLLPVKEYVPFLGAEQPEFDISYFKLPLWAVALGVIYYIFNIRHYSNYRFHEKVRVNLRAMLWQIGRGSTPVPAEWTDKKVKGTFYHLVDNSNSLTSKSKLVYFNGYIWTLVADARAVAFLVAFLSVGMLFADPNNDAARISLSINAAVVAVSLFFSHMVTKKHIELSNDQLSYIEQHLKDKLDEALKRDSL